MHGTWKDFYTILEADIFGGRLEGAIGSQWFCNGVGFHQEARKARKRLHCGLSQEALQWLLYRLLYGILVSLRSSFCD